MKYLLDTHTYLWFRTAPRKLPAAILDLLADSGNELLLSLVIPWEIAVKVGIGKLDAAELLVDMESRETAAGFTFAPLTIAQVIRSGMLFVHHRDPFDRLLVAQALEMQVPLISCDTVFDLYGVKRVWE